jgi:RHS repeat-associated protein
MTLGGDGKVLRRYEAGPLGETIFDQAFNSLGQETALLAPLGDHQNSTRVVAGNAPNGAVSIRQSLNYTPFGRASEILDANGQQVYALDTVFTHHGSIADPRTGLQLKGARWYSPDLGRFVSVDPIEDGANWYMFAGNDPINFSDPTGLSPSFHPLASPTLAGPNFGSPSILSGLSLGAPSYNSSNADVLTPLLPASYFAGPTPGFRPELQNVVSTRQSFELNAHLKSVNRALVDNTFASARPTNSQFAQTNRSAGERAFDSYLGGVGQVFAGYGDAVVGAAEGAYQTLRHPLQTAQNVYTAARHPILTGQAILGQLGEQSQTLRGQGQIVGDVLSGIATGGALKALKQTQVAQRAIDAGTSAARSAVEAAGRVRVSYDASTLSTGGIGGAKVYLKGRAGEALASTLTGAPKNTQKYLVQGQNIIPDFNFAEDVVTRLPVHIGEAKNVAYQSLTRQLRNEAALVGPGGRVDVFLPQNARVSGPLQKAFESDRNPLNRIDLMRP